MLLHNLCVCMCVISSYFVHVRVCVCITMCVRYCILLMKDRISTILHA